MAAIPPATQLTALQTRMADIQARILARQGQLATNEANHAIIMAALDALNYETKVCQAKIDGVNTILGNPAPPDNVLP